jgi:hypothetical protein
MKSSGESRLLNLTVWLHGLRRTGTQWKQLELVSKPLRVDAEGKSATLTSSVATQFRRVNLIAVQVLTM